MISPAVFKQLDRDKVKGVLVTEFLLYGLALALQGFSLSIFCLFMAAGWIRSSRPRLQKGIRGLPGPWGLPIIGRVHDIDMKRSWFKFKEWGDKYGPIYQTTMMGTTHVWISSHEIAVELLAKRGAIYSDRPGIPHMPGTKDGVEYLPFLKYGETWRRQRKFGHTILQRAHAAGYHGHLVSESYRFLASVLHSSQNYDQLIDRYLGRITCLLGWGTPDPVTSVAENAHTFMYSLSPAGPLANALPALMWFPEWIVRSKKMERHRHTEEETLFTELLEGATLETASGRRPPCYSSTLNEKRPGFAPREAAYTVGMMANIAILTTGSPLRTFLLAMVLHQDWQRVLQAELDTVLGEEDRLVALDDAPRLPTLRAIIKECFRWRPVIPTGIPHELEKDDVWNGYFIPKGAYIHAVEWSLARDPAVYPDPNTFNPGRYLDPTYPTYREPLTEFPTIRGYHGFGFGRRICPGQEVAEAELLVACAALAWGFKLGKKRGPCGQEIPINDYDFTSTLITTAKPFEMEFDARSEKHAQTILDRFQQIESVEHKETMQV